MPFVLRVYRPLVGRKRNTDDDIHEIALDIRDRGGTITQGKEVWKRGERVKPVIIRELSADCREYRSLSRARLQCDLSVFRGPGAPVSSFFVPCTYFGAESRDGLVNDES